MTAILLGIDIGTSGCKALLIDTAGAVVASATVSYPLAQPRPGWTEQDPALWIEGARAAIADVLAASPGVEILAIGLSGQMHGMVALDDARRVLRPAPLWNDQRNGAECDEIVASAGGLDELLSLTNNRMLIGYTGGKVVWLRNHEPETFAAVRLILNPKDYLRLVLTGEVATEVSDASGTGLFDVRSRSWSAELMRRIDLDPAILPPCHESHVVTGRVSRAGAALFGLPEGVPVVGGGGDSVIQTLGSGVTAPGDLQTTIGTAGIVAAALDAPRDNPDGRMQVFCNVAPATWHAMGVSLNAGGAMAWFRSLGLFGDASFDEIVAKAAESPAGSRGLLFLPYLYGERCPHPDPEARAAFVGLTARHTSADMARSVLEGVCFALYDISTLMQEVGIGHDVVKASGGGARSMLWRQMQADLFGCDVVTTEGAAEGGAFGAALVAGLGVEVWADLAAAGAVCRGVTRETPDAGGTAAMRAAFATFRELYPALRPAFAALHDTESAAAQDGASAAARGGRGTP